MKDEVDVCSCSGWMLVWNERAKGDDARRACSSSVYISRHFGVQCGVAINTCVGFAGRSQYLGSIRVHLGPLGHARPPQWPQIVSDRPNTVAILTTPPRRQDLGRVLVAGYPLWLWSVPPPSPGPVIRTASAMWRNRVADETAVAICAIRAPN